MEDLGAASAQFAPIEIKELNAVVAAIQIHCSQRARIWHLDKWIQMSKFQTRPRRLPPLARRLSAALFVASMLE
jgi:hypothetical protein